MVYTVIYESQYGTYCDMSHNMTHFEIHCHTFWYISQNTIMYCDALIII